jgi:hypothetical protein
LERISQKEGLISLVSSFLFEELGEILLAAGSSLSVFPEVVKKLRQIILR